LLGLNGLEAGLSLDGVSRRLGLEQLLQSPFAELERLTGGLIDRAVPASRVRLTPCSSSSRVKSKKT
jgi:hypothetical protein